MNDASFPQVLKLCALLQRRKMKKKHAFITYDEPSKEDAEKNKDTLKWCRLERKKRKQLWCFPLCVSCLAQRTNSPGWFQKGPRSATVKYLPSGTWRSKNHRASCRQSVFERHGWHHNVATTEEAIISFFKMTSPEATTCEPLK